MINENDIENSGDDGISLFDGTSNRFEENEITGSALDGIRASAATSTNRFEDNEVAGSGVFSCEDASTGGGTAGTANTWDENEGEAPSSPLGICGDDDDDDGDDDDDDGDDDDDDGDDDD